MIVITPDGKTAYVTSDDDLVMPIATATNTPGKPIEVGRHPDGIAITPDGKTVYVANTFGTADQGRQRPVAVAITPDGKAAYVAGMGHPGMPVRTP